MKLEGTDIRQVLINNDYLTEDSLKKAEQAAKERRLELTDYLLAEELITNDLLGQAVAESFGVPYADLNSHLPNQEQVLRIPEEVATQFRVVFFEEGKNEVVVTTDQPKQAGLAEQLQPIFLDKKISIAYSLPNDIQAIFVHYRKPLETRFSKIIKQEKRVAPEIIDEVLDDALVFGASDIHFEPLASEVVIRFRVDGVLREAGRVPKEYYENIVNRVKVQANLRIDDHFSPQDGAIRLTKNNTVVDLRVSIAPLISGEKITIRILSQYVNSFSLVDLGLSEQDKELLAASSRKPFGMILMTGPTGSGKTTTLYAVLRLLNNPGVNITTIEDPVEYRTEGVNQIQVNTQTDLTFAKGLRSIVRQDPDIILVGEVRDQETAEIAVNAALTGHLLLSTFHANSAAAAIPRLLDMGVEPFLLGSTLELVAAQRLVRRLCEKCRYSVSVSQTDVRALLPEADRYFKKFPVTLYRAKGCQECGGDGYKGRIAIYEFILIDKALEALILEQPSAQQIWDVAQEAGARSMFEDGITKVGQGITSLEELLRVARPAE